jgi:hypothetical protein
MLVPQYMGEKRSPVYSCEPSCIFIHPLNLTTDLHRDRLQYEAGFFPHSQFVRVNSTRIRMSPTCQQVLALDSTLFSSWENHWGPYSEWELKTRPHTPFRRDVYCMYPKQRVHQLNKVLLTTRSRAWERKWGITKKTNFFYIVFIL